MLTVPDEKDCYWQIKQDEESAQLKKHQFRCIPVGINSETEVFQQHNCETFRANQGVHIKTDDTASTEKEHDVTTQKAIARAK